MNVNIYSLSVPDTLEIKYIGRTKNSLKQRLNGHIQAAKKKKFKTRKDNWILNLLNNDKKPIISLLTVIEGWEESYLYEQDLIKDYLDNGFELYNLKDLGRGHVLPCREDVKIRISNTVKKLHEDGVYKNSKNLVPLYLYDLEGNWIKDFISISECARFLNISNKNLECSLKRNSKRLHEYQIRKFKKDKIEFYERPKIQFYHSKKVTMFDMETNDTFYFESLNKCREFLNVPHSTLSKYVSEKLILKNRYKFQ